MKRGIILKFDLPTRYDSFILLCPTKSVYGNLSKSCSRTHITIKAIHSRLPIEAKNTLYL